MQRILLIMVLCVFGAAFLPSCRTANKIMPDPVNSMEPRSDMRDVIVRGMQQRGWKMVSESEGTIRAVIYLRSHTGIVDIHYTDTIISFEHVSSTNLKETETTIHKNYISWLNNLRQDIAAQMLLEPAP